MRYLFGHLTVIVMQRKDCRMLNRSDVVYFVAVERVGRCIKSVSSLKSKNNIRYWPKFHIGASPVFTRFDHVQFDIFAFSSSKNHFKLETIFEHQLSSLATDSQLNSGLDFV